MQEIRRQYRKRRQSLSHEESAHSAKLLFEQFLRFPLNSSYQHIAAYFAFDGEIDPVYIIEYLWSMQKSVYMPVLTKHSKIMQFAEYEKNSVLKHNSFGINEPMDSKSVSVQSLDLILLPLVAFDRSGHRLGMGAGYYDSTLTPVHPKPRLIGLAFEFQCVDHIIHKESDVRLDGIVTDKNYYEILAA